MQRQNADRFGHWPAVMEDVDDDEPTVIFVRREAPATFASLVTRGHYALALRIACGVGS